MERPTPDAVRMSVTMTPQMMKERNEYVEGLKRDLEFEHARAEKAEKERDAALVKIGQMAFERTPPQAAFDAATAEAARLGDDLFAIGKTLTVGSGGGKPLDIYLHYGRETDQRAAMDAIFRAIGRRVKGEALAPTRTETPTPPAAGVSEIAPASRDSWDVVHAFCRLIEAFGGQFDKQAVPPRCDAAARALDALAGRGRA